MSEFFKYGSQGKEINFEQFKQKLSDSDVKNNSNLQKLFKIFDTDNSGTLEETNSKGDKELESLFSRIKQSANSDGNDELSGNELEMFINSVSPNIKEEEKKDIKDSFKSFLNSFNSNKETSETKENIAIDFKQVIENFPPILMEQVSENKGLKQIFKLLDSSGDGILTKDEIQMFVIQIQSFLPEQTSDSAQISEKELDSISLYLSMLSGTEISSESFKELFNNKT